MRRRVQLHELPQAAMYDRGTTLRRVLSDLPEPMLAALVSGLEFHGDDLCSGRLHSSPTASCAAGAMIRQLNPADFEGGTLRFAFRHLWRRRAASYGGELSSGMHTSMIESTFDRAVLVAHASVPGCRLRDASRVVGRWFLEEALREMHIRDDRRAAGQAPAVDWRDEDMRRWGEGMERRLPQPRVEVSDSEGPRVSQPQVLQPRVLQPA